MGLITFEVPSFSFGFVKCLSLFRSFLSYAYYVSWCSLSQASLVILEFLQIRTQASEMPCILRLNLVSATYQLWYYNTSLAPSTTISHLDYCSNLMTEPVHSKGDHSWVFFGMNDAKAETPVLWPPHAKSWLIGKDSDAGRDCRQEEKGMTEDEMAGWHHWLDGCEFEWTPGVGDGQGGLACCNSWGRKESDTTERLNWTELNDWSPLVSILKG